jgi:hypothetical protein
MAACLVTNHCGVDRMASVFNSDYLLAGIALDNRLEERLALAGMIAG